MSNPASLNDTPAGTNVTDANSSMYLGDPSYTVIRSDGTRYSHAPVSDGTREMLTPEARQKVDGSGYLNRKSSGGGLIL